jgi:hypothetical protein
MKFIKKRSKKRALQKAIQPKIKFQFGVRFYKIEESLFVLQIRICKDKILCLKM